MSLGIRVQNRDDHQARRMVLVFSLPSTLWVPDVNLNRVNLKLDLQFLLDLLLY
jgi:hypothetical protein